jgi:hypothetical protein
MTGFTGSGVFPSCISFFISEIRVIRGFSGLYLVAAQRREAAGVLCGSKKLLSEKGRLNPEGHKGDKGILKMRRFPILIRGS